MIQRPKGTNDIYGREAKVWKYVETVIDQVMEKYNYNYIRTPIFESSELFHRGIGETTDIVTKETYDFIDRGERHLSLRPEGTAGVCRSYIENKMLMLDRFDGVILSTKMDEFTKEKFLDNYKSLANYFYNIKTRSHDYLNYLENN